MNAIAHLHYFNHNSDAWITELDVLPQQRQAFGLISLSGMPAELGYIDLVELQKTTLRLICTGIQNAWYVYAKK